MFRNPMIVHISDLHFGNCNSDATEDLKRAITKISPPPDFILVTGDLTDFGLLTQLEDAKQYLKNILESLWTEQEHIARCIVIPGNHDLQIGRCRLAFWERYLKKWKQVFGDGSFSYFEDKLTPAPIARFYEHKLQRRNTSGQAAGNKDSAKKLEQKARSICEYFPEYGVAFVKVNSVSKTVWHPLNTIKGYVTTKQLIEIEKVLEHYKRAFPSKPDSPGFESARLIALMHHHVNYLPNVKHEPMMLMDDAGEVWQRLAKLGFDFILHGHHHRAAQLGSAYWEADGNKRQLIVLSAGSATANKPDDGKNSFYTMLMRNFKTEVWYQTFDNNRFSDQVNPPNFVFPRPLEFHITGPADTPLDLNALTESLDRDELTDNEHAYTLIEIQAVIDESRNYYGFHVIKGKNKSLKPTHMVPFSLAAVGAQTHDDFNLKVIDLKSNKVLTVEFLESRSITLFPIRINFDQTLYPEEEFEISINYKLPHVMHYIDDYDFINLSRYPLGVDKVVYKLFSTRKIVYPIFMAVYPPKVIETTIQPMPTKITEPLAEFPIGVDGFGVEIEKPSALCYIFYYRKLCPHNE